MFPVLYCFILFLYSLCQKHPWLQQQLVTKITMTMTTSTTTMTSTTNYNDNDNNNEVNINDDNDSNNNKAGEFCVAACHGTW